MKLRQIAIVLTLICFSGATFADPTDRIHLGIITYVFPTVTNGIMNGGNVNATKNGKSFLLIALEHHHYSAAALLIVKGAQIGEAETQALKATPTFEQAIKEMQKLGLRDQENAVLDTQRHTVKESEVPGVLMSDAILRAKGFAIGFAPGEIASPADARESGRAHIYRYDTVRKLLENPDNADPKPKDLSAKRPKRLKHRQESTVSTQIEAENGAGCRCM